MLEMTAREAVDTVSFTDSRRERFPSAALPAQYPGRANGSPFTSAHRRTRRPLPSGSQRTAALLLLTAQPRRPLPRHDWEKAASGGTHSHRSLHPVLLRRLFCVASPAAARLHAPAAVLQRQEHRTLHSACLAQPLACPLPPPACLYIPLRSAPRPLSRPGSPPPRGGQAAQRGRQAA